MAMEIIPLEEAKKICTKKGLRPGRVKGTDGIQFTRGKNARLQEISWADFEMYLKQRSLAIYESNGWMKIMKK
ncbi:MAG: hypothetical protein L0Z54_06525 [Thermoplasmata archaeon]|nr:hypothetical protein [Thermoplasmata archaeon]